MLLTDVHRSCGRPPCSRQNLFGVVLGGFEYSFSISQQVTSLIPKFLLASTPWSAYCTNFYYLVQVQ